MLLILNNCQLFKCISDNKNWKMVGNASLYDACYKFVFYITVCKNVINNSGCFSGYSSWFSY